MRSSLTALPRPNLRECRHPLSDEERVVEERVLATIVHHFSGFDGSLRDAYDAMTEMTPIAEGLTLEAVEQGNANGWWIRPRGAPADRAILFIHGGGYGLGSASAYRGFASQIVSRTGVAAFVLDYPLAPEHRFPAAYEAVVEARRWLGALGIEQIALIGDSAGGGLSLAALAEASEAAAAVSSVVVFSPWTDLALAGESMQAPEQNDPIFQAGSLAYAAAEYLAGANPRDCRASPLYGVPARLPPLLIQVGTAELLLDDSRRYAELAAEQGNEVVLDVFEGLHHVFQRAVVELPSARRALDMSSEFITAHW
jgi:epsilon-lactone hydrolase